MEFFILIYCAQDDYKSLVDKYCLVRDDFERKMTLAAKHFQDVESAHLKQMREFIESYCQIVDNNNNLLGRVRILFLKSHILLGPFKYYGLGQKMAMLIYSTIYADVGGPKKAKNMPT